jgi:hypothetical protein
MPEPVVVSIPHRLGKEEATRRLKTGLGRARTEFASLMQVEREDWSGDRLTFDVKAMAQTVHGSVDVAEDHVRIEVMLPWLLARIATTAQAMIQKQATLMLEKK